MLGWVSEEQAAKEGFDYHASYYGIPIYWRNEDNAVWCKHPILDPIMDVFTSIEQFMRPILFPMDEVCFQFRLVKEINKK